MGSLSVTARFDGAADQTLHGAFVETLSASDGVARCELWTAADQGAVIAEEALRGKDRQIATCLCVDTLRPEDAERVAQQIAHAFRPSAEIGVYRLLCEIAAE